MVRAYDPVASSAHPIPALKDGGKRLEARACSVDGPVNREALQFEIGE
jgi:hypothetical protein